MYQGFPVDIGRMEEVTAGAERKAVAVGLGRAVAAAAPVGLVEVPVAMVGLAAKAVVQAGWAGWAAIIRCHLSPFV